MSRVIRTELRGETAMSKLNVMTWWDPASADALRAVMKAGKGSTEIIMKKLGVGYCRADFLLKILQRAGIVSTSRNKRGNYQLLNKRKS